MVCLAEVSLDFLTKMLCLSCAWEKIKKSKMPQNRDYLIQDRLGQRARNSSPSHGTAHISSGLVRSNRHC